MSDMKDDICPDHEARLLEGWFSRDELARELGVSVDTLARWETRRIGPPSVRVGRRVIYRRVIYRRVAVLAWLEAQERRPVK